MSDSVRDFSTTEAAPFITIDDEPYNLIVKVDTLAALEVRDIAEEYDTLLKKRGKKRTEIDNVRIVAILNLMMERSVEAPAEVLAKLDDLQKGAIVKIVAEEIKKRRDPTEADGEPSPDSTDSTEPVTG